LLSIMELGWIAKASATSTKLGLPELHLVAAWLFSAFGFAAWFHFGLPTSALDMLIILGSHVVILPILSRNSNPVVLLALGFLVFGIVIGLQLVDLCFDILIVWDHKLDLGGGQGAISGRMSAWVYYHTMLNAKHVNLALALFLLVGMSTTLVGITRSAHAIRWKWYCLIVITFSSNAWYFVAVVPRYAAIRASVAFDDRFFDGWWTVFVTRLVFYVAIAAGTIIMCSLVLETHRAHQETNNDKAHSE